MTAVPIHLRPSRPPLDDRPLAKRIGLIILATDHTTEPDFRRMVASEQTGVYVARLHYANPTTPDNLRAMQPALAEAAELILPGEELDAICFSCSSASVVIGDEAVARTIHQTKPAVPVVTPIAATVRGLQALGARRISVLTPYTVETSNPMAEYLAECGLDIASFTCLGFDDDRQMARIVPEALVDLAREATAPDAEALFVSCTALRAAAVTPLMEAATGRPVVTSNLSTAWNCLRLCGDHVARPEWGRLMETALAS